MNVLFFFFIFFFITLISKIQAKPHIVNSLPGYDGHLPFTLETGYVGVGEKEEVQLFYYFIESERDVQNDPLMLWLTGGPGCSAFSGLVFEIGPVTFDTSDTNSGLDVPKLKLNPYSWTKQFSSSRKLQKETIDLYRIVQRANEPLREYLQRFNQEKISIQDCDVGTTIQAYRQGLVATIIFLDSPVGTGFSYATTYDAYYSDDDLQSAHIYDFLRKWLVDHPKFRRNTFYVAGDSYSGLIVPMVVLEILNGNELEHQPKINLKGYVLGNPTTTDYSEIMNSQIKYFHRVSLLSDELYQLAEVSCNGDYFNADESNTKCLLAHRAISEATSSLDKAHVLEHNCVYVSPKPTKKFQSRENQMKDDNNINSHYLGDQKLQYLFCRNQDFLLSYTWADDSRVREALNIREGSIDRWVRCNGSISYKGYLHNAFEYHQNFTKKYLQALIYSGDQDSLVSYVGTLEWINQLQITITEDWRPWFVDGQIAGYVTEFGSFPYQYHLVYATIKGAGHTAPEYKPRESLAMIDRWFSLSLL
ncbi:hypothetical protein RND81_03G005300 [Saponaria officinalis]|uniref:Uncharacterized protein n=1 Tax=Saponaria officinalis TaxID=3572 RepID=A0AAW1M2G6_SAPOF